VPERNWHTAHARRVPLPVTPPELLEPLEPAPELAPPLPLPASSDAAQPLGSSQQVAGMHVSDVEAGQSRPTSATGHSGNALLVGSCAAAGGASVNANDATRTTTKCDFICVFLPPGSRPRDPARSGPCGKHYGAQGRFVRATRIGDPVAAQSGTSPQVTPSVRRRERHDVRQQGRLVVQAVTMPRARPKRLCRGTGVV
jgi:hypothetical protein